MTIEIVLKRTFHGVALLLIAAVAYFQARGATQLLGIALASRAERKSLLPGPRTDTATAMRGRKSAQAILDRNPFDSVTGPFRNQPANGAQRIPAASGDASDPLSWPACEGVQVLIVTESSDPWWSLATLQASGEVRPGLKRVGDGIAGKQVAFIGYNPKQQTPAVWLAGNGALCQSLLFQRAAPASASVSAPAAAAVASNLPTEQAPQLQGVLSHVRAVPELRAGRVVGLRLFGIRPGSLLGSLGLRNGDRLESINGFEIATPERALQAYVQLRTASDLHVLLNRVGQPLQLDLHIS